MSATTLHSTLHFAGRIVRVRTDEVRLEDGTVVRQEVVEHAPSVTIVPMLDDRRVVLIRQYRHPAGEVLLETPAGSVGPGESSEHAAQRELAEEIGQRAERMIHVGSFYLAPGWATERMEVFVATGLHPAQADPDTDERIDLVPLPLEEVWHLIRAGEIHDCKTIAAVTLAQGVIGAPPRRD